MPNIFLCLHKGLFTFILLIDATLIPTRQIQYLAEVPNDETIRQVMRLILVYLKSPSLVKITFYRRAQFLRTCVKRFLHILHGSWGEGGVRKEKRDIGGLLFNLTYVNMRGPNKQLNRKSRPIFTFLRMDIFGCQWSILLLFSKHLNNWQFHCFE